MEESKKAIKSKDPICGICVDESTSLQAELNGRIFYFCGFCCRQMFLTISGSESIPKLSLGVTADKSADVSN